MNKSKPSIKPSSKTFSDLAPKPKKDALGLEQEVPQVRRRANRWVLISVVAFAWAAGVAALTVNPILAAVHSKASALGSQADSLQKDDPNKALLDYKMAHVLDPQNPTYVLRMADLYLDRQQPNDAINALMQLTPEEAGEKVAFIQYQTGKFEDAVATTEVMIKRGKTSLLILQAKALIEEGNLDQAQSVAKAAQSVDGSREEGIVLEAIANKLAGKEVATPESAVSSPERLQQLRSVKAGELPLAQSLYALGLLRSSERVLAGLPANNTQRFVLQANVKLAQKPTSRGNLLAAADYFRQALVINPADIELHKSLQQVYQSLGNKEGAQTEDTLIKRLQTGSI